MRLVRLAAWMLGGIAVYGLLHVGLALHPRPLFSHHRTYKNFTVHMREEVPAEIVDVLDRVDNLLSRSELNDPRLHHEIYIFNSYRLIRYLMLRNVHFGANLPNGVTYITDADVVRDVARCERIGPQDHRRRTLSESIVHEITHALIRNHVGRRTERRLPSWIKEGYCELVARGSAIDPETGIALLKAGRGGAVPGLPQLRNRLMVEYLVRDRGRSIDELLDAPPGFGTVEAEMLAALRSDEAGLLERLGW